MFRSKNRLVAMLTLSMIASSSAQAQMSGIEFSADIVQKGPQGQASTGKMYIGKDRIRTDMNQNGQEIIHIVDNTRQTEWLLYPAQRSYMEMRARRGDMRAPDKPSAENPCQGMPGAKCKNLGKEKVSGRDSTKWEMTFMHEGKTLTGMQWIDDERGIPLRQVMPDGQSTELRLVGPDTIEGRKVEKWEMMSALKNEAPQRSFQWYDPKLELAIREEFPGGFVRELRNISEGKQPDVLFSIPAGFRQLSPPSTDVPNLR